MSHRSWGGARLLAVALLAAGCGKTVIVAPARPSAARASTAATLGIPPGHLPKAGQCRVWSPGVPPGRQAKPRSRSCEGIARTAPAGSWILFRPGRDKKLVHVRVVDQRRAGVVVRVRVFEIETGRFVREERP